MASRLFYEHTTASLAGRHDFDRDAYYEALSSSGGPGDSRGRTSPIGSTQKLTSPADDRSVASSKSSERFRRYQRRTADATSDISKSGSPQRRTVSPATLPRPRSRLSRPLSPTRPCTPKSASLISNKNPSGGSTSSLQRRIGGAGRFSSTHRPASPSKMSCSSTVDTSPPFRLYSEEKSRSAPAKQTTDGVKSRKSASKPTSANTKSSPRRVNVQKLTATSSKTVTVHGHDSPSQPQKDSLDADLDSLLGTRPDDAHAIVASELSIDTAKILEKATEASPSVSIGMPDDVTKSAPDSGVPDGSASITGLPKQTELGNPRASEQPADSVNDAVAVSSLTMDLNPDDSMIDSNEALEPQQNRKNVETNKTITDTVTAAPESVGVCSPYETIEAKQKPETGENTVGTDTATSASESGIAIIHAETLEPQPDSMETNAVPDAAMSFTEPSVLSNPNEALNAEQSSETGQYDEGSDTVADASESKLARNPDKVVDNCSAPVPTLTPKPEMMAGPDTAMTLANSSIQGSHDEIQTPEDKPDLVERVGGSDENTNADDSVVAVGAIEGIKQEQSPDNLVSNTTSVSGEGQNAKSVSIQEPASRPNSVVTIPESETVSVEQEGDGPSSNSRSSSSRKGMMHSILKTERSSSRGSQRSKRQKSIKPVLISCKFNQGRGFSDLQVRKHKNVYHGLIGYEKGRTTAKSLSIIIIEELFTRDFWPGKHWEIDTARVWECTSSEHPSFHAEKLAKWDWKEVYSEASATALIRFLPDRILIEDYAYSVAG